MSFGLPIYQGDEQPFSQHDLFSLAKLNCPEAHGAAIRQPRPSACVTDITKFRESPQRGVLQSPRRDAEHPGVFLAPLSPLRGEGR